MYGERGRGDRERQAPRKLRQGRGSTKAVGLSEFSSNAEAICPAKSLSDGTSRTITGGAVFYAPPKTHTKAKYHQPHRAVTHQERGAPEPPRSGRFDLFASTGGGHRRTDDGELNAAGVGGGE